MAADILFVVSNIGSFRLQAPIAEQCRANGDSPSFLYSAGRDAAFSVIEYEAGKHGLSVLALEEELLSSGGARSEQAISPRRTLRQRLLEYAARKRAPVLFGIQQQAVRSAQRVLLRLKPAAIIVSEDGISGPMALLAAARRLGIPVVDVPYGCATRLDFDKDLDRKAAAGDLKVNAGLNGILISLLCPQWIKAGHRAGTLMFTPEFTLATAAAGISLENAWIVHGGNSERLCVQSEVMREEYLAEGIASEKLTMTGSPYCDEMLDGMRADEPAAMALLAGDRIEPGTLKVLLSWPPSYHKTAPGQSEFETYEDMTRAVITYLKNQPGVELTLSVHPAAGTQVSTILQELGVQETREHIVRLLARHDVIVPYYSTTTHWALAAGKIVANYDAYKLGLTQFDSAPGFLNTTSFDTFKSTIAQLTNAQAYANLARAQLAVAHRWGILDSQCTARTLAEVDRVITSGRGNTIQKAATR